MDNLNMKFMKEVARIEDPVVFLGLATTLGVDLYTQEKDEKDRPIPKEFGKLFEEMMSRFDGAGRKFKRELLGVLRKANKEKDNGFRTKDTETTVQDQEM